MGLAEREPIVVRKFTGSSKATTALMQDASGQWVRKLAVGPESDKLEYQYAWLSERMNLAHLPRVRGFRRSREEAVLDLEFYAEHIPFFDYIHSSPVSASARILESILSFVGRRIHGRSQTESSAGELERYLEEKVLGKVAACRKQAPGVDSLMTHRTLRINGRRHENFPYILEKILGDREVVSALAQGRRSPLHGDLTVDNLIVDGADYIILDPNGENHLSDPLVDYAKLYQSLHTGYEFLCGIPEFKPDNDRIELPDPRSPEYRALFTVLASTARKHLGRRRARLLKFHEAVHYARMLPYKAHKNPGTTGVFFATMVRLFNEFYEERHS